MSNIRYDFTETSPHLKPIGCSTGVVNLIKYTSQVSGRQIKAKVILYITH